MANVAINGLSRIGRVALRIAADDPQLDILAVNDSTDADRLLCLLKDDVVYGQDDRDIRVDADYLFYGDRRIRLLNEPEPLRLPWSRLGIDIVFECSGNARPREELVRHLEAGARHVILSTPESGNGTISRAAGAAANDGDQLLFSTGDCSAQCIAPVAEIIARRIGVSKAVTTTVQSYLSTRGIIDAPGNLPGEGHGRALNLFPATTTTAAAIAGMLPQYRGCIDGIGIHVPMASGSVSDMTFVTERRTSVAEVNAILREEAQATRYQGILAVSEYPVVSADVMMDSHASLVDLSRTRVIDGDLVKVMSWIDNEWGFASQMIRQAGKLMQ